MKVSSITDFFYDGPNKPWSAASRTQLDQRLKNNLNQSIHLVADNKTAKIINIKYKRKCNEDSIFAFKQVMLA